MFHFPVYPRAGQTLCLDFCVKNTIPLNVRFVLSLTLALAGNSSRGPRSRTPDGSLAGFLCCQKTCWKGPDSRPPEKLFQRTIGDPYASFPLSESMKEAGTAGCPQPNNWLSNLCYAVQFWCPWFDKAHDASHCEVHRMGAGLLSALLCLFWKKNKEWEQCVPRDPHVWIPHFIALGRR